MMAQAVVWVCWMVACGVGLWWGVPRFMAEGVRAEPSRSDFGRCVDPDGPGWPPLS